MGSCAQRGRRGQAEVDEEAVRAVCLRCPEGLPIDRDEPPPLLARGFGHELLYPEAECGDLP